MYSNRHRFVIIDKKGRVYSRQYHGWNYWSNEWTTNAIDAKLFKIGHIAKGRATALSKEGHKYKSVLRLVVIDLV